MLREAMRKAQSTDAKKVALALEGMTYKGPMGEVRMRQGQPPARSAAVPGHRPKQGSKGVKHDAEKTIPFRSKWPGTTTSAPSPRRAR